MTICPYGKMFIPKGSVFNENNGLRLSIQDDNKTHIAKFIHSADSFLESGEKFVSVTETINESIIPKKIKLYCNSLITIENMIKIVLKYRSTKKIIAIKYVGQLNQTSSFLFIELYSSLIINLNNDEVILEIHSINQQETDPCCDKLPSQIIVSDTPRVIGGPRFLCIPLEQYYTFSTTTTTTSSQPFIIDFLTHPSSQTVNLNTTTSFSFSAISTNDIDFSYWFEVSKNNGSSWSKISKISTGKSRQIHSLFIEASVEKNNFKYRIVISKPIKIISNIATLNIIFPTTTTTTPEPCIYNQYYMEPQNDITEDIEL